MVLFNRLPIRVMALLLLFVGLFNNNLTAQCANNDSSDEGITPDLVAGNPALCSGGFRIDPPASGTFNLDAFGNTVTVTITNDPDCGEVFSWSVPDNIVIDHVIAKGGSKANDYDYTGENPRPFSDGFLHSPLASSGKYADLSHIDFCFHYKLTVSKTATTTFTRTWNWEIEKTVTPDEWAFFSGDEGTSKYTVSVDKVDYTDSDWAVSGTITVENNTPYAATITSIADALSCGGGTLSLDCEVDFPYVLAAGATLECTYTVVDMVSACDGTNTATVATSTPAVEGDVATAPFTFGDPTTVVNDEINVTDTNGDSWGPVSDDASWMYERTFDCGDEGTNPNTATIVETNQDASADVKVTCYELTVVKNATTTFDRNWAWMIEKSGDQTELSLAPGQSFLVNYSVDVDASYTDDNFAVSGNIQISNPHPSRDAPLTAVSDIVSPNIAATVSCPMLTVPAGGSLTCTYTASLPNNTQRLNTATASLQNYSFGEMGGSTPNGTTDFTGTTNVVFGSTPTNEYDECVDVTDNLYGALGTVCAGDAPTTFNYSMYVGPFESPVGCGDQSVANIASFETSDNNKTGSDEWTVEVNVVCEGGCTLTQGYWKTHSEYGPAPYDDTWAQLPNGANTTFFLSGKTYYQTLWTAPAGNAYWNLAHQYIAAKLNQLNGASIPPAVLTAFNTATTLFNTYTPAQIAGLPGNNPIRKQFINLAGILDKYNNGITGPGHCSEESNGRAEAGISTALSGDFSVYPNPTTDAVQVDLSNFMEQSVELVLYNQLGAIVLIRRIEKVDVPIYILRFDQGLTSGYYNLTLVHTGKRLNKSLIINN